MQVYVWVDAHVRALLFYQDIWVWLGEHLLWPRQSFSRIRFDPTLVAREGFGLTMVHCEAHLHCLFGHPAPTSAELVPLLLVSAIRVRNPAEIVQNDLFTDELLYYGYPLLLGSFSFSEHNHHEPRGGLP